MLADADEPERSRTYWRASVAVVAVLMLAGTLVACGTTLSADEVVGQYTRDSPNSHDTLTVSGDGTFAMLLTIDGEQAPVVEGTWSIDGGDVIFNVRDGDTVTASLQGSQLTTRDESGAESVWQEQ
jgi:hypothetical protein